MPSNSDCLLPTISKRSSIMALICDGTTEKRELAASVSVSRPTLDRAIRELEEEGLVLRQGTDCRPTLLGRLAMELYHDVDAKFDSLQRATPLFESLSADISIEMLVIEDANVYLNRSDGPHRSYKALESRITQADTIRGMLTVALPSFVDLVCSQILENGTTIEVIIDSGLCTTLHEHYSDQLTDSARREDISLYTIDRELPFNLLLIDETDVFVSVFTDEGAPLGMIRNETPDAQEWARIQLQKHKANAGRFSVDDRVATDSVDADY
ncbi:helix-turn-helix transcriptional regulator [Natrarchaeobius sp. A-rgal3]|uniref:helix-turn-helix transcriptional regulator n=1 Tax=Natrarchaeobius versutus TaxID=1679078 RepID=UPI00350F9FAA